MILNFKIIHFFIPFIAIFYTYTLANEGEDPGLIVSKAYANKPLTGSKNTAGFMTLTNLTEEILSINKISCLDSVTALFHKTSVNNKSGIISMDEINRLVIKPKTTVNFKPGGKHVMLMGIGSEIKNNNRIICYLSDNKKKQYQIVFKFQ